MVKGYLVFGWQLVEWKPLHIGGLVVRIASLAHRLAHKNDTDVLPVFVPPVGTVVDHKQLRLNHFPAGFLHGFAQGSLLGGFIATHKPSREGPFAAFLQARRAFNQ